MKKRRHYPIVIIYFLVVLLTSCWPTDSDSADSSNLDQALDKAYMDSGLPGVVVAIKRPDGSTWISARGQSVFDKSNKLTATPSNSDLLVNMKFRIGSVTKSFTALLTVILAEEGFFSLDDPISKWFPNISPNGDRITLRHLLNMTGGIPDYEHEITQMLINDPYRTWTPEEILDLVRGKPVEFEPGQGWNYCNTGYVMLGLIAEKETGFSYRELLEKKMLGPLQMKNTSIPQDNTMPQPFARGYQYFDSGPYRGWVDTTDWNPSAAGAAGYIISNVYDLMIWLEAIQTGKLIKAQHHAEMFDFKPTDINELSYGYGIYNLKGAVGHNGFIFGYTSCMYRYKGHDFIVLTNGAKVLGQVAADGIFSFLSKAIFSGAQ